MWGGYNYNNSREWMYRRFDETTGNISAEFRDGVDNQFMPFANSQELTQSNGGKFYCPCSVCKNKRFLRGDRIWSHLYQNGFVPGYHVWYKHGEELDMSLGTSYGNTAWVGDHSEDVGNVEDRYVDMVNHAFQTNVNPDNYHHHDDSYDHVEEHVGNHSQQFYNLIDGANNPLYDGCREGHSQLSFAAELMQYKTDHNMSERLVDSMCGMFRKFLPEGNQATGSYFETEILMRNLNLTCHTIDVCVNIKHKTSTMTKIVLKKTMKKRKRKRKRKKKKKEVFKKIHTLNQHSHQMFSQLYTSLLSSQVVRIIQLSYHPIWKMEKHGNDILLSV